MMRAIALSLFLLGGCAGEDDPTDASVDCGDVDGNGGDTGDVPPLLGDWTSNYGQAFLDGNCRGEDVPKALLDFLEQPSLLEGSVPNAVRLTFADNQELTLRGSTGKEGAMAMSGVIPAGGVLLHTAIGGMVYEDAAGRVRWDGGIFIGADLNDDTIIDCEYRADWKARKSGS